MGRSEGAGCYCYANNVLKNAIGQMSESYPYVVLDNEAGLENLSRRIVQKVNLMVMIADPSKRGLETVKRLHELALEMNIEFDKLAIVVNRLRKDEIRERGPAGDRGGLFDWPAELRRTGRHCRNRRNRSRGF
jgi:CO dehydrogenase maturation factor